jgi:small redox-active disulfide protein 2
MKIEILGPGCAKCNALYENAKAAVQELGLDCEIVKVSDIGQMASRGVLVTPALAIDDEVRISGKVLTVKEIVDLLG